MGWAPGGVLVYLYPSAFSTGRQINSATRCCTLFVAWNSTGGSPNKPCMTTTSLSIQALRPLARPVGHFIQILVGEAGWIWGSLLGWAEPTRCELADACQIVAALCPARRLNASSIVDRQQLACSEAILDACAQQRDLRPISSSH